MEALRHVPRPAVLYVTKVNDAEEWHRRLLDTGFVRVRMLHGKTGREQRERIVDEWRNGEVDIVVGTSAFGLGIDYPHARSVLHACVPETLDRFYQEVGRGGRDGRASLSLIASTPRDFVKFSHRARPNKPFVGGPKEVADGLEQWFTEPVADGFVLAATHVPGTYMDFVRYVVPELQRRGLYHRDYAGTTLRENLGLPIPRATWRNTR